MMIIIIIVEIYNIYEDESIQSNIFIFIMNEVFGLWFSMNQLKRVWKQWKKIHKR